MSKKLSYDEKLEADLQEFIRKHDEVFDRWFAKLEKKLCLT